MLKFILGLLLAVVAINPSLAQVCDIRFTGHIEDADTKQRLPAATVNIREINRQIITDNNGDFLFENLCAGNYTLLITHVNCEAVEKKVAISRSYHIDIFLPHARRTLGEILVEGQTGMPKSGYKDELSGQALEETRGLSLADALSRINGVSLLQTGSTISKPVIHGLHGNRILTINNGVRQEGQQWGNEHAPEIDPFIAGKLVVMQGVDELKYGSDAIGGVVLVEPRPIRSAPGYGVELNTGYFTNNNQYLASVVFERRLANSSFAYRVQGTYKKAANVQTPGYRLKNTASGENNFSLSATWKNGRFNNEAFYSYFNTRLGIFTGSHIGNLTDLIRVIELPRPDDVFLGQNTYSVERPYQNVTHHLLKLKSNLYKDDHKFSFQVSGQYNHRKEFDILTNNNRTSSPQLDLTIFTLSEDFTWEHPKRNSFSGSVGLAMMQQENDYDGRYFIPNYLAYSFGMYAIEKWTKHNWELQAGLRYDNKTINTTRIKTLEDTINKSFNFSTLASSFNALYKAGTNWKLNANITLASRAPQVNELLSNGIHHGTGTYERGNIGLKPERSLNTLAGIEYLSNGKNVGFSVNVYNNNIRNFIYQQPRPDSPVLTIAGAFPLIEYAQTNAVLNGVDASVFIQIISRLRWKAKGSVLYARDKIKDDWLILMPANRFTNELSHELKDKGRFSNTYISAELVYATRQSRVPDEKDERQDYKAAPPGYAVVNGTFSTTAGIARLPVTFTIAVNNLLDRSYRSYLNSMRYFTDEMGRNISFRMKIPFERNY